MTVSILVLMGATEDTIVHAPLRSAVERGEVVVLSEQLEGIKGESERRLVLLSDAAEPSKELDSELQRALPHGESLLVALHQGGDYAARWKGVLESLSKRTSVGLFSHKKRTDLIYAAIQEVLAAWVESGESRFGDTLPRLAALLEVDWELEAKLVLLHACLGGELPASPQYVDIIPESGPTQAALQRMWVPGTPSSVPSLSDRVQGIARPVSSVEGAMQRQILLRALRDDLLADLS